jgi:Domain of unknown function (DUF389)
MISPRWSRFATALVPPFSSSAICLARGEFELAFGAFLLAFTNIVAIQVAGSIVMWLGGYRGSRQLNQLSALKRNLLSVIILCVLAIFLGGQLQHLVSKQIYETSVRKLLTSAAKSHSGAHLVDVRFQERAKQTVVVAVYRAPSPFTPEEVRARERQLPRRPGISNLELLVRRSRSALHPTRDICSPMRTHADEAGFKNKSMLGAAIAVRGCPRHATCPSDHARPSRVLPSHVPASLPPWPRANLR